MVFLRRGLLGLILVASLLTLSLFALQGVFNVPNVSALTASSNVGVFWDAACTKSVTLTGINWGNVSVGTEKDVPVYVKNLGQQAVVLSMNTSAWNPTYAPLKMYMLWDYGGSPIAAGSVIKLTLRLYVSTGIGGVTNFKFNINIGVGLEKSFDINGDGAVDISDATLLALAWNSKAGSPNYKYNCDFNNDGTIDITDAAELAIAIS